MEARGFTLLELLVALGIAATLAGAFLWGAHAWIPDVRLDAAVRQVVLDLRSTRAMAMGQRRSLRLAFAPALESYTRQRRVADAYEDDGPPIELPAGIDLVDCNALADAIGFVPRGTASTFGTVTLRTAGGHERRVIVDIVGRIRVE